MMKRFWAILLSLVMAISCIPVMEVKASGNVGEEENVETRTVVFDANGGEVSETNRQVKAGEVVGELPIPLREGYIFGGWYLEPNFATLITEDTIIYSGITLYAQWLVQSYMIGLDVNGGDELDLPQPMIMRNHGEVLGECIIPTRTGYTFKGWYTPSGELVTEDTVVGGVIWKLVAQWEKNEYTVKFSANGGTSLSLSGKNVLYGDKVGTLPTVKRTGYTFKGWYTAKTGGTKITTKTVVDKNMTVYAQWIRNISSSNTTVKLSATSFTYDGKYKKPTVKSVKVGSKTLKSGTDYKVVYTSSKGLKNIGSSTVKIVGMGNYKGTITKTYKVTAPKNKVYTVGANKYKVTGTDTVAFNGLKSSSATKVTVPSTVKIGGKTFKVTSIAANALKGKTKVTSVTVGEKVKTIGANAFYGCKNLSKITVKSTVLTSVGKNALKGIKSTATIKVPAKKLTSYKKVFKSKGQETKVKITK